MGPAGPGGVQQEPRGEFCDIVSHDQEFRETFTKFGGGPTKLKNEIWAIKKETLIQA